MTMLQDNAADTIVVFITIHTINQFTSHIQSSKYKPLRKLDSAHYDVTGHEVKWYKQTSGHGR